MLSQGKAKNVLCYSGRRGVWPHMRQRNEVLITVASGCGGLLGEVPCAEHGWKVRVDQRVQPTRCNGKNPGDRL